MRKIGKTTGFWPVQTGVWILAGCLNYFAQQFNSGMPVSVILLNAAGLVGGGFAITSIYRYYLKQQNNQFKLQASKFILSLLGSTVIQSICWLALLWLIFLPTIFKYHIGTVQFCLNFIPLTGVLLIWNLVYIGYHLLRQYHTTEVERWKLEAEIQKARLGALKSQINPHFMFNALNNIRALILEDPQVARDMVTKFSEIFRHALQHSEDKEITVAEELKILSQYLELIRIQYEEKLQYQVNADNSILSETMPPMILQLLAENAVKHGVAASPSGGEIIVDIKRTGNKLLLIVKNTGTLSPKKQLENNLGIGLKNITERLKLLYDNDASLSMEEHPPYVVVTISINKYD
jgi:two-component system LytT family sensor kinase